MIEAGTARRDERQRDEWRTWAKIDGFAAVIRTFLERYPTVEALRSDLASFCQDDESSSADAGRSWVVVLDELAGLCGFLRKLRRAAEATNVEPLPPPVAPLLRLAIGEPKPNTHTPSMTSETFRREGDSWAIAYEGNCFSLKDAKGLRHIAHLLRHPNREFYSLELVGLAEKCTVVAGLTRFVDGDAGPMLDCRAKREYRDQLAELEHELEEAESLNDLGLVERLRRDIEFLTDELARSVGLGGRDRKAASATEKARQNVSRAIKASIEKIAEHSPSLGRHFAATVKSGIVCSYTPDPRLPIRWQL
jgi:hypothetical protein